MTRAGPQGILLAMAQNRLAVQVGTVLRIRDLYAERDPRHKHLPRYTHAQIAKMLDISPSTVARVINREGAYAWVGGESMGEIKLDPAKDKAMADAAAASLLKLQSLLAAEQPVDDVPDPAATLDPELQAKVDAIQAKLKLGN